MSVVVMIYILTFMWIYSLHVKIGNLQRAVDRLQDEKPKDIVRVPKEDIEAIDKLDDIQKPTNIDEPIGHVGQFKESYPDLPPQEPSKIYTFLKSYFTEGNILVRIGGVVLFFGLVFLVKYAAQRSAITIEMRLLGISVGAIATTIVGWRLRAREGGYGLILQGLGIATLYLIIYSSSKFYSIMTLESAFLLMIAVVAIGSLLAVIQDALPLALFATTGGFAVPILTADSSGSHIVLFSYYALLDIGIFAMAWYRSWRILNIVGFLFTFIIALAWGVMRYQPELFGTTEPFLILYFLLYLAISILFTLKHPFEPKNLVDATLVFGLPLVAFPIQVDLVRYIEYGAAYSAVALGTLYLILYWVLRGRERSDLLSQSFLALSVVFYTIAIPYAFDADLSSALWSLESSAIIWIALKQSRRYARYFGELLLGISILVYPTSTVLTDSNGWIFANTTYLGYIIVITSALISSYLLDRGRDQLSPIDKRGYILFLLAGVILWFVGGSEELVRFDARYSDALLLYLIVGTMLLGLVATMAKWKIAIMSIQGYQPLGIFIFIAYADQYSLSVNLLAGIGWIAIGLFILFGYALLYRFATVWRFANTLHIAILWLITLVAIMQSQYIAFKYSSDLNWVVFSTAIAPLLLSSMLMISRLYRGWIEPYRDIYQRVGVGGLVILLSIWELLSFVLSADMLSSYIPILNPLDLVEIASIALILYWVSVRKFSITRYLYVALAFMGTTLASVIFARAVHHYMGIEYEFKPLWSSIFFQAGLSIVWSLLAISLMLFSQRRDSRPMWIGGFILFMLVVIKLFFVELSNSGTVERIVSFMAVGSLLLLIGYFAPLPPAKAMPTK